VESRRGATKHGQIAAVSGRWLRRSSARSWEGDLAATHPPPDRGLGLILMPSLSAPRECAAHPTRVALLMRRIK